jgi:hypothetical protein
LALAALPTTATPVSKPEPSMRQLTVEMLGARIRTLRVTPGLFSFLNQLSIVILNLVQDPDAEINSEKVLRHFLKSGKRIIIHSDDEKSQTENDVYPRASDQSL